MRSLRPISIALLLALLGPLAVSAAQEEQPRPTAPPSGVYRIRYEVRYLDVHSAEVLAWEQCTQKESCRVAALSSGRGSIMEVDADSATHERIARALAERDAPRTQAFQLVLLAASPKPNGPTPALAPGAQKALDDLKGFLPFKSYRIVDTALLRATRDDVARARIAGSSAGSYKVAMRFRSTGLDGKKLFIDGFSLDDEKDHDLIQTSFAMDVGETVVVGTSSAGGSEEALVAILTAMP